MGVNKSVHCLVVMTGNIDSIDNINNISLTLDESVFQGLIGYNLGVDLNENDIADLEMSIDYANLFKWNEEYFNLDNCNYKYNICYNFQKINNKHKKD